MKENIITVDIVEDIIKATYTGGRYKGEEVRKILDDIITNLQSSSLLLIDMQKASPLDYVFCQYAFGPIIKVIQGNNKPIIFKMLLLHKRCFYRGILKHVDKTLPRNTSMEEAEKIFLGTSLFTMITTDGKENIEFIGNLNSIDDSILKFINESHSVSERDIINAIKDFQPNKIIESLNSLNKKGFIINPKNGSDNYCSVYEILKSN